MRTKFLYSFFATACLLAVTPADAGTVVLKPVADASLFENQPNSNSGQSSLVAGRILQSPGRTRALIRFDPASAIPSNAIITSAEVKLFVSKESAAGGVVSTFELRRLLVTWGEGIGSGGGGGAPADTNEVTWNSRFHPATTWSVPGGNAGADFASTTSGTALLTTGAVNFASSPSLVSDINFWLSNPNQNHGWLLQSQNESTQGTAHRFYSREAPVSFPELRITYLMPVTIAAPTLTGNQFEFAFNAISNQTHRVERTTNLTTQTWLLLTNFPPAATNRIVTISAPINEPQSYYRIALE